MENRKDTKEEKDRSSLVRNKPQRYAGRGDLHFITFSCFQRRPLLNTVAARNLFVKILDETRLKRKSQLIGYVVMPEHVHQLISEPELMIPSRILQILKRQISYEMRGKRRNSPIQQTQSSLSETEGELRRFWQRLFYGSNVYI